MSRAIFLDRDGVINRLIFNPETKVFESPHYVDDLKLFPWAISSLKRFLKMGYLLFLVSNQPSFAKGKTTIENIHAIHDQMHKAFQEKKIFFAEYYYCYHHPEGVVDELTCVCKCRKPGTKFLEEAEKKYHFDKKHSWFIGDRDSDILCGNKFGLKTIFIKGQDKEWTSTEYSPDFEAENLRRAVDIVSNSEKIK